MSILDLHIEAAAWQKDALCRGVDPDLFFPERGASTREAKAVCHQCPVQALCLEYALQGGEKFGIWGGKSERERRRIRRARSIERKAAAKLAKEEAAAAKEAEKAAKLAALEEEEDEFKDDFFDLQPPE